MANAVESVERSIAGSKLKEKLCDRAGAMVGLVQRGSWEAFPIGTAVAAEMPMEIGSLTKVFTALLAAEAVRRGELQFSTRIDGLLFNERWAGEPAITVQQLATHTSGLPRLSMPAAAILLHPRDPYRNYDRKHLMEYLRKHKPRALDAPRVSYSNLGYAVLGLMLEKAASKTYEELLHQRILAPLNMAATGLQLVGTKDLPTGGYSGAGRPASLWHMDGYAPCGAMVSTVNDLVRAVRGFLDPGSPVAEGLAMTLEPRAPMPGGSMGLGWVLPASGNSFWHNGATAGYTSYLGIYKPSKAGVAIVANQALAKEATELGHQLLRVVANDREGPVL